METSLILYSTMIDVVWTFAPPFSTSPLFPPWVRICVKASSGLLLLYFVHLLVHKHEPPNLGSPSIDKIRFEPIYTLIGSSLPNNGRNTMLFYTREYKETSVEMNI